MKTPPALYTAGAGKAFYSASSSPSSTSKRRTPARNGGENGVQAGGGIRTWGGRAAGGEAPPPHLVQPQLLELGQELGAHAASQHLAMRDARLQARRIRAGRRA